MLKFLSFNTITDSLKIRVTRNDFLVSSPILYEGRVLSEETLRRTPSHNFRPFTTVYIHQLSHPLRLSPTFLRVPEQALYHTPDGTNLIFLWHLITFHWDLVLSNTGIGKTSSGTYSPQMGQMVHRFLEGTSTIPFLTLPDSSRHFHWGRMPHGSPTFTSVYWRILRWRFLSCHRLSFFISRPYSLYSLNPGCVEINYTPPPYLLSFLH